MRTLAAVLGVCLLACAAASADAPLFTNAELVSLDPLRRVVVVRSNDGETRTMRLDDGVGGLASLSPGDEVLLVVRDEPGMPRISRIFKSSRQNASSRTVELPAAAAATLPASPAADPPPPPKPPEDLRPAASRALATFDERVALAARQALFVDALWADFAGSCAATVRSRYDRAWFGLWEGGAVQSDLSSSFCRDLLDQVLERGEWVRATMSAAEEAARRAALLPGSVREVRRRYAMDWDGWDRVTPQRRAP